MAKDMPFPICAEHAAILFRRMQQMIQEFQEDPMAQPQVLDAVLQSERAAKNTPLHRVYYIRVGDLIKIGVTKSMRVRMQAYPPNAELLAVEQGGEDLESARHHQFRHLLAHRQEWFRADGDLMQHIADLQQQQRNRRDAKVA